MQASIKYPRKKGIKLNRIDQIVLILVVFGVYALNRTSSVENKEYSWLVIIAITFGVAIFHILKNKKINFGIYMWINLCFLGITYLSRSWAISSSLTDATFKSLILTSVIIFSVINILDNELNFKRFIQALAWGGVLMFMYLGITKGFINIINIRETTEVGAILDLNANDMGLKYIISALSFRICGYKSRNKKLFNLLCIAMVVLALLTGSRKVIIMLAFCLLNIYIFEKKRYRLGRVIVAIGILMLGLILIMNNKFLYDAIGVRVQETFTIFDSNKLDPYSSTGIRASMMETGINLFKERPLLGYGLANAALYNGGTYLHNNYLELLVGVGIIGTIIYYLNPIIGIIKNIMLFRHYGDKIALLFLMIGVCILILDFAYVSYNARVFQLIIAVSSRYYFVKLSNEKYGCYLNKEK